jgi:hypothetical protein
MTQMPKITALLFWFGGVIAPELSRLVAQVILNSPIEQVPSATRLRLRELATDLALGRIWPDDFCNAIAQETGSTLNGEQIAAQITAALQPDAAVIAMIDELPAEYERWLICDYPVDWFDAVWEQINTRFSHDRVIFTLDAELSRFAPDVFYHVARAAGQPLDMCLMIDENSKRAVEAVSCRMHSTIHVDAVRTRRDFVLRRILPPPPGYKLPEGRQPQKRR